jgi:hypothetical protein
MVLRLYLQHALKAGSERCFRLRILMVSDGLIQGRDRGAERVGRDGVLLLVRCLAERGTLSFMRVDLAENSRVVRALEPDHRGADVLTDAGLGCGGSPDPEVRRSLRLRFGKRQWICQFLVAPVVECQAP